MIQFLQEACFLAFDANRPTVQQADLAEAYKAQTGCLKRDNVFSAKKWRDINPAFAVSDLQ